jgi:hypothetical protein
LNEADEEPKQKLEDHIRRLGENKGIAVQKTTAVGEEERANETVKARMLEMAVSAFSLSKEAAPKRKLFSFGSVESTPTPRMPIDLNAKVRRAPAALR